jgi:2-(1,2-epoxy-1,2-dihydrophenyl)acetyl-CoA isomerase
LSYETLRFDGSGPVASIVLNRPESANGLTLTMARELMDAAIRCDEEARVRAVLLRAEGRMFCVGGDIKAFPAEVEARGARFKEMTTYLHAAIAGFVRMGKPVVTAVQGPVAGAGLGLALCGDVVLAARSASFVAGYAAAGLAPDGGATYFLPRLMGLRRAQDFLLSGTAMAAEAAHAAGLVTRVVEDGDALLREAEALAASLAAGPARALALTKRLLQDGADRSLERQLQAESDAIAEAASSRDGREGIAAFLEKRRPKFTGE